jgi:hypothetical protein
MKAGSGAEGGEMDAVGQGWADEFRAIRERAIGKAGRGVNPQGGEFHGAGRFGVDGVRGGDVFIHTVN